MPRILLVCLILALASTPLIGQTPTAIMSKDTVVINDTLLLIQKFALLINHDSVAAIITPLLLPETASPVSIALTSLPERSWYDSNQVLLGSLFGALLAGLFVIMAVRMTATKNIALDLNRRQAQLKNKERRYLGFLHAIVVELNTHEYYFKDMERIIDSQKSNCIKARKFIVTSIPVSLPLKFIDSCRLNILEYDLYNTLLLNEISSYRNACEYLNLSLNMAPYLETQDLYTTPERLEIIETSFGGIEDHRSKLSKAQAKLRLSIKIEMEKFENVQLFDTEPDTII